MKLSQKSVIKIDLSPGTPSPGFISIYKKPLNPLEAALFVEKKLPLKDNSVTLIQAAQLLEHIEPKKFFAFMNEVWRVLKIDGQFLISVPYGTNTGWCADPYHINHLTAQTWFFFDPDNATGLYQTYKPKPWHTQSCSFQSDGIMETLLVKLDEKK